MRELPFVARPVGDLGRAQQVARDAALEWGLPPPELIRSAMNALFGCGQDVVVRVGRTTAPPERAVWLAGQLAMRGVRVPRHVRHPLSVDDLSVFAVERVHPAGDVDWQWTGEMVRTLHEWPTAGVRGHHPLPTGADFPWWDIDSLVQDARDLIDDAALAGISRALAEHGDWRARVTVSDVLCHGDVHPGNVLQSADGPVLLDWDLLCTAPPAWDHAAMVTWEERWGGTAGVYARFAEGYGHDHTNDPLARSLTVMRNLSATLMRVLAGRADAAARAEAERRLAYWRGDRDAPQWTPM